MKRTWGELYSGLAVILLNTAILFVLLNLAAAAWLTMRGERVRPGALGYEWKQLEQAYPDLDRTEIEQLLTETWTREYEYEPFTQFREGPFSGRYVNVDERGFRVSKPRLPWPPPTDRPIIFVFGGSTTFGYGVSDSETIPSAMAAELLDQACGTVPAVYNLARSNYFSTQERLLFEQMLADGHAPDIAIFIDGLNEFTYPVDEPKFTERLRYLMAESGPEIARRTAKTLPLVQMVLAGTRNRAGKPPDGRATTDDGAAAREVVERWLTNRRMISALAADFGVQAMFVWQPVPTFAPAPEPNPFIKEGEAAIPRQAVLDEGYRLMDQRFSDRSDLGGAKDLLWLAGLQKGASGQHYVDRVHYSVEFSRRIGIALAEAVAQRICPAISAPTDQGSE